MEWGSENNYLFHNRPPSKVYANELSHEQVYSSWMSNHWSLMVKNHSLWNCYKMGHTICTSQETISKGSSMNTTFKKDVDCSFSLQGLHLLCSIWNCWAFQLWWSNSWPWMENLTMQDEYNFNMENDVLRKAMP